MFLDEVKYHYLKFDGWDMFYLRILYIFFLNQLIGSVGPT
jgi:hypothetical protein